MSEQTTACPKGHAFTGGRCANCGAFPPPAPAFYRNPTPQPKRTVRKFLIQFEGDDRTRWLASDEQIRRTLESLAKTTATSISGGTIPATFVSIEP